MLKLDKVFEKIFDTAKNNTKHPDYQRTVDLNKLYKALITGEGAEDYIRRFNLREDEDLFKQRLRLTQIITAPICNGLMSPSVKVDGVRPIVDKYEYSTNNEAWTKELTANVENFYGNENVSSYISNVVRPLSYLDPNAFVLTTFQNFDNRYTKPTVFSTEISCKDVYNFEYQNNILQFVLVNKKIEYETKKKTGDKYKKEKGEYYTIWSDLYQIELEQVDNEKTGFQNPKPGVLYDENFVAVELVDLNGNPKVKYSDGLNEVTYYVAVSKGKLFEVTFYLHNAGEVPLYRAGFVKDPFTDGRTCVNLFHPATPHLIKTIERISELDMSFALHVFLQKFAYYPACPGYHGTEDGVPVDYTCNRGYTTEGKMCRTCHGRGTIAHTSSQDVVEMSLPDNKEEMFDLDKLIHYASTPTEIVEILDKYIDKLEVKCMRAVYSSDMYEKSTVATTATQNLLEMQSYYDALKPYSNFFSFAKVKTIRLIAKFRDIIEGLVVLHKFPTNLRFETVSQLLERLQAAKNAEASESILQEINEDISEQLFIDNPVRLKELQVKAMFNPFNGKTIADVQFIISNNLVTQRDKVIYANFPQIFNDLEYDQISSNANADVSVSFYFLAFAEQKKRFDAKVLEYMNKIKEEQPKPIMSNPFNEPVQ